MSGTDLLFHMADVACVRAEMDEGWKAIHQHLLKLCQAEENPGWKRKVNFMNTKHGIILNHLKKVGTISIREGMDDYNLSGGHLTKIISDLRKNYGWNITMKWQRHPITKQRYARYYMDITEQLRIAS